MRPPALCLGQAQASSGVDCAAAFSGGQTWVGFRDHLASLLVFINQPRERAPWVAPWGRGAARRVFLPLFLSGGAETSLASPSPPGHLVDSWGPCTCVLSMPSLRSGTRLCPCTDVALGAEPWLVTSLELRDLAQASRCHWRQKPWDRVWEGLPGAELLCEDPWGPQPRVFPESCRVFLRVLVMGRGQGAGLRVLSLC